VRWLRGLAPITLIAALTMAAPQTSLGQTRPAQSKDERELQARELFGFGKYAEALAIYGRLYAETAHPTYLRNIGRCYQNLGEPDKAINAFREYLRQVKNLAADQRAIVEGYIREMREMQEQKQKRGAESGTAAAPAATPPARTAPPPPPPPPREAVAAAPSPGPDLRAQAQPDDGRRARRTLALAVGGAGVVALGIGGYFGMRSFSKQSDGKNLCPHDPCGQEALTAFNSAATSARVSDVLIGAGLVGAGVAAYLFFTSPSPSQDTAAADEPRPPAGLVARLRLSPALGPGHAGLVAGASW
jgi:tetratricopeptide (TPR) repeat protein